LTTLLVFAKCVGSLRMKVVREAPEGFLGTFRWLVNYGLKLLTTNTVLWPRVSYVCCAASRVCKGRQGNPFHGSCLLGWMLSVFWTSKPTNGVPEVVDYAVEDHDRETENSKVCARTRDTRFIQVRAARVTDPTSCLGIKYGTPSLVLGCSRCAARYPALLYIARGWVHSQLQG
jgi:hypothetical protein